MHVKRRAAFQARRRTYGLELEASTRLLELEKEFPEDNIVLVGAQNVEEVKSAFRNYFNDVKEFIKLMVAAQMTLDPKAHAAAMRNYMEAQK